MSAPPDTTGGSGGRADAGFVRASGIALAGGAVLLVALNAVLTPLLPASAAEATLRTSTPYLLRASAALASSLLLLLGTIGPHLVHRDRAGALGAVAFATLFAGTALVVAVEWSNLFVMRPLARASPGALGPLGDATLLNVGLASALGLFTLGWLLMAGSLLRTRAVPRWIPSAIVVGLLGIAGLGAAIGSLGAVIGNLVFGAGLVGLGRATARAATGRTSA